MNDTKGTLIRLMRMALGCEPYEPMTLPEREWKEVYMQVCQQTLTGVIYCVVNRMSRDVGIPKPLLMEWTLKAEAIRGFNAKMNAEAARLTRWFGERGRKTAGAVMWMMSELFSMESDRMICPKDERHGRWMLDEALKSGNFGWYHENRRKGYWQTVIIGRLRPIRLLGFSFQECLWINVKFVIRFIRTIPKRIKYRRLSLLYFHEE